MTHPLHPDNSYKCLCCHGFGGVLMGVIKGAIQNAVCAWCGGSGQMTPEEKVDYWIRLAKAEDAKEQRA